MYLNIENNCMFLSPCLWGISICIPVMGISGEKNSKILIVSYIGKKNHAFSLLLLIFSLTTLHSECEEFVSTGK